MILIAGGLTLLSRDTEAAAAACALPVEYFRSQPCESRLGGRRRRRRATLKIQIIIFEDWNTIISTAARALAHCTYRVWI
jgi:hypothetical protein